MLRHLATLENLILIAPKISVATNFKGSFQAFATKDIAIEQRCVFKLSLSIDAAKK